MTDNLLTADTPERIPDDACLGIEEAAELLRVEFRIRRQPKTLRKWAKRGTLPFFRINPDSDRDPFLIRAKDLRTHIWNQQNKAINACTGK